MLYDLMICYSFLLKIKANKIIRKPRIITPAIPITTIIGMPSEKPIRILKY
jgi:hypothetical protein